MNDAEYNELEKLCSDTTCRQLSDYARKVLLEKPVNVKYRNVSVDDFLTDMLALKKELNAIGNNFNQSVHKLHILRQLPDFHSWVIRNEHDKKILFQKISEIMNRLNELYKLWLP